MLTKKYIKSRNICKVTFEVPTTELPGVAEIETVTVAGDFNDWDKTASALGYSKKKKAYRTIIELEPSQEYQFRYLINGDFWFNDWKADGYVPTPLGEDNCVLRTSFA